MDSRIKVNVKVMEDVSDMQFNDLIKGLNKIDGFEFLVDSSVRVIPTRQAD